MYPLKRIYSINQDTLIYILINTYNIYLPFKMFRFMSKLKTLLYLYFSVSSKPLHFSSDIHFRETTKAIEENQSLWAVQDNANKIGADLKKRRNCFTVFYRLRCLVIWLAEWILMGKEQWNMFLSWNTGCHLSKLSNIKTRHVAHSNQLKFLRAV